MIISTKFLIPKPEFVASRRYCKPLMFHAYKLGRGKKLKFEISKVSAIRMQRVKGLENRGCNHCTSP